MPQCFSYAREWLHLNNTRYDDIRRVWENEAKMPDLQDLDDLTVGEMGEYLANVRLALTEVPAENVLQAELYTREIENIEYMLKDLLLLRREKILRAVLEDREIKSSMTLAEEEFFNRLSRGFKGHTEFVEETLSGKVPSSQDREDISKEGADDETLGYIVVRFTRDIDTPFMGLDERAYGPFKSGDIATIPTANAQAWLRDGTVIRVVVEDPEESE